MVFSKLAYDDAINPAASVLAREVIAKGFFDPLRSKPSCFKSLACHVPHWVIIVELQISSLNASVGNPADGNELAEPGESAYIIRPFHDRLVQRHCWHFLSAHRAKNHHNSVHTSSPPGQIFHQMLAVFCLPSSFTVVRSTNSFRDIDDLPA